MISKKVLRWEHLRYILFPKIFGFLMKKKRVWESNLITNYSKSQQFCVLLHILLEKGHFEKLNCEIKFMGTFNTAKKAEF